MTSDELKQYAQTCGEKFWVDAGNHWLNDRLGLTPESRVIDVGGYLGNWTAFVSEAYDCYVDCYEPVREYYYKIVERLSKRPKIRIFNSGVEAYNGSTKIAVMNDGSSMYVSHRDGGPVVRVRDIVDVIGSGVDVLAINGEGCEYNILDRLLTSERVGSIRTIMVQFHVDYPDAELRRDSIRERLGSTHQETFCYPFTWEIWRVK